VHHSKCILDSELPKAILYHCRTSLSKLGNNSKHFGASISKGKFKNLDHANHKASRLKYFRLTKFTLIILLKIAAALIEGSLYALQHDTWYDYGRHYLRKELSLAGRQILES
jgi:hypothetical protein